MYTGSEYTLETVKSKVREYNCDNYRCGGMWGPWEGLPVHELLTLSEPGEVTVLGVGPLSISTPGGGIVENLTDPKTQI